MRVTLSALLCFPVLLAAQEGAPPNAAADSVLTRLIGAWSMVGTVQGDSVTYDLRVRRTLGNRFIELSMLDVARPPAYEARVFIGADTGAAPRILVHWMDSFGAAYSAPLGAGTAIGDTVAFTIDYSSGQFRDRLTANGDGTWRFLIESRGPSGWSTFADYRVVPAVMMDVPVAPPRSPAIAPPVQVQPAMLDRDAFTRRMSEAATRLLAADESLAGREMPLRVALVVDEFGRVTSASIAVSSGNARVDAEALRILRLTRFSPGLQDGREVISRVVQPIRFRFEQ